MIFAFGRLDNKRQVRIARTHIGAKFYSCFFIFFACPNERNIGYGFTPNYYVIGQFNKFIRPGAVRIGLSSYTAVLETTAFMNTDGSIAVVIYNSGNTEIKYILRIGGMLLERTALPYSVETVIFKS